MARASRLDSRFDTALFALCVFLAIVVHGLPDRLRDPLTCVVRGTGRILDDEDKYASVLED